MTNLTGLVCPVCDRTYPVELRLKGCDDHRDHPSSVVPTYDDDAIRASFDPSNLAGRPNTIWRYEEFLPVDAVDAVTMGEGMTPLVPLPRLGAQIGIPRLLAKNESMNPTWSHKDRLASVVASIAGRFGKTGITASSSGNAGSAMAAYAARAGLDCIIFTVADFPTTMKVQMQVHGTKLVAMPTVQDRWTMVETLADDYGWMTSAGFSWPAIGSNPYGVDGYKTLGFEICEQLGWRSPDTVVIPAGGDLYWGAWKGFEDFARLGVVADTPRMVAAETFGPLKHALAAGLDFPEVVETGPTVAISAGVPYSSALFLKAARDSGGLAEVAEGDDALMDMQLRLAALEGIYAEASSVQALAVAARLAASGEISPDEEVVVVLTSSGLKHPEVTAQRLPPIPAVEADFDQVLAALQDVHGFTVTTQ